MAKKFDVVAITGEYQNKIGVVMKAPNLWLQIPVLLCGADG